MLLHKNATMASSAEQARLEDLLTRTGLNDRQVGEIIGVSQPTVWRLRNGRIGKVGKHLAALERHLGIGAEIVSDAQMIADLVGYSHRIPALRAALTSLHKLMRENA